MMLAGPVSIFSGVGCELGSGGFCPQKNWQNSVLFLVRFMHVWYVDKEMEQTSGNCPP